MIKNYNFVLDVDGVLTNGKFLYSNKGKVLKEFGPHDAFSLKKIKKFCNITFISADNKGFKIDDVVVDDKNKVLQISDFKNNALKLSYGKKKHYLVKII